MDKSYLIGGIIMLSILLSGAIFYSINSPETDKFTRSNTASLHIGETVNIKATDYSYTPNIIHVKQGQHVQIQLNNHIGTHDFVLEGYDVTPKNVADGDLVILGFVANKIGSFNYYCSTPGHREAGMSGRLIVNKL